MEAMTHSSFDDFSFLRQVEESLNTKLKWMEHAHWIELQR